MWTNAFAYVGGKTTGYKGGNFALVGPHWQGKLPGAECEERRRPAAIGVHAWLPGKSMAFPSGPRTYDRLHVARAVSTTNCLGGAS